MRARRTAIALMLFGAVLVTPTAAQAKPDCNGGVKKIKAMNSGKREKLPASCLKKGEKIKLGKVVVEVPGDGEGYGIYHVVTDKDSSVFDVEIENVDGSISVSTEDPDQVSDPSSETGSAPENASAAVTSGGPNPCDDGAKKWNGRRNNGMDFYVNGETLPAGLSYADFSAEVDYARNAIRAGNNSCGFPTNAYSISLNRKGSTSGPAMNTDGSCNYDSYDEIDFGVLDDALGQACVKWTTVPFADDRISEADIRLDKDFRYFRILPSNCTSAYEVSGLLVHEFGHSFGMGHVSEDTHGQLTMSTNSTRCSYADHSFGLGDYNNMNDHY